MSIELPDILTRGSASDRGRRAVEILARWGLAAIGVSYLLVAGISLKLAISGSGQASDREGALARIAQTGWGVPALIVIAIGFAGYAAWRLVLAITGENVENDDDKHPLKRVGYAARGLLYAVLTFVTLEMAFGGSGGSTGGGSGEEKQQASTVLGWPGGRWIIAGIGLAFVAGAIFNAYRAVSRSYKDDLKTFEMPDDKERVVTAVTAFGLFARMTVFGIIGWFLLRAAVEHNPDKAVGLDGALQALAGEAYGRVLLAVVALGLVAYAAFRFIEARYRTV
ncbi:MAG TPA: DUF1206 domain-containing protein [Actinomycetota bacterium]|nr:DUF1206 domain-containing protein [Actinomycetota bacterium]